MYSVYAQTYLSISLVWDYTALQRKGYEDIFVLQKRGRNAPDVLLLYTLYCHYQYYQYYPSVLSRKPFYFFQFEDIEYYYTLSTLIFRCINSHSNGWHMYLLWSMGASALLSGCCMSCYLRITHNYKKSIWSSPETRFICCQAVSIEVKERWAAKKRNARNRQFFQIYY